MVCAKRSGSPALVLALGTGPPRRFLAPMLSFCDLGVWIAEPTAASAGRPKKTTSTAHESGAILAQGIPAFVFAGPSAAKMDDEVVGDSSGSEVVGDEPQRPTAPREVCRQGPTRIFVLVASVAGLWQSLVPAASTSGDLPAPPEGQAFVLGAVLAHAWSFASIDDPAMDPTHQAMRRESLRGNRASKHFGFIDYPVISTAEFREPPSIPWPASLACLVGLAAMQAWSREPRGGERCSAAFGDVLDRWGRQCGSVPTFVTLGPGIARYILRGVCSCLHIVPITLRVARKRLLISQEPGRRRLKAFMATARNTTSSNPAPKSPAKAVPKWAAVMQDPSLVLAWLDITQYVKAIRKVGALAIPFSKLFARCSTLSEDELEGKLQVVGYPTLRLARMRLDCVAMLVWRRWWSQTLSAAGAKANVYIFCDASPTWRGVELWASSFDVFDGEGFMRRLFPCVALNTQLVDAKGKTMALLWQIFLLVGPSFDMVRRMCGRVRGIVTDMGVERKICDMPDVVAEMFELLCPGFKAASNPIEFLWPRAVQVPGWKHQVDLLIRQGLNSMKFFPLWLKRLKALNSFLRQDMYLQTMASGFRQSGLSALADSILAAKLPTFAEWRWGTLFTCLRAMMKFLDSLIVHFDPAPFSRTREGANLSLVIEALGTPSWRRQCDFVFWLTQWLTSLMDWGCGCPCHEAELLEGKDVACPRKGRRLQEAEEHVQIEFSWALREANAWDENTWGCDFDFLVEAQGCVRAVVIAGRQKFEFLGKLPYLLVQLTVPGGRKRVLDQWASAAPEQHHRVSREFLLEGCRLRSHIDHMNPDGTNMHPELLAEVESLCAIPMDDSVAEGPHARAKRVQGHARSCQFPWVASSMRLAQNLTDCEDLLKATGGDLMTLWCGWKSLTRVGSHESLQNKRTATGAFLDSIYRMNFDHAQAALTDRDVPADDGKELVMGVGLGAADVHDEAEGQGLADGAGKRRRIGVSPLNVGADSAQSESPPLKESEEVTLMRQWLSASLERYSYISAPVIGEDGHFTHMFFQILSTEHRQLYVRTFQGVEEQDAGDGLYTISAQPLSRFRAPITNPEDGPGMEAEVFIFTEPVAVDILGVCGGGVASRHHWHVWSHEASDLAGCVALRSPRKLAPRMALSDSGAPVLALCDELRSQGFDEVRGKVTHEPGGSKHFDCRGLPSKRTYLQCVLESPQLFAAGVESFTSGHSGMYYKVLLKTKRPVDPKLSAKELKRALATAEGDTVALAALSAGALVPVGRRAQGSAPLPLEDIDGEDSVVGDDDPAAAAIVVAAEDAAAEPLPGGVEDQDMVVGDALAEDAPGEGVAADAVPDQILGQAVVVVQGRHDARWSYSDRLTIRCRNPDHGRCTKSRSLALDRDVFGPRAAEGYLGAWLLRSDLPAAEHSKHKPSRADIRAYLDTHERI